MSWFSSDRSENRSENEAERAFNAQDNEEVVVIDEEGLPHRINPNQPPRGQALRDSKGEY